MWQNDNNIMAQCLTLGVAEKDDLWPVPKVQDQKPA